MLATIQGYFNWRDQYLGAMNIRAHRRDLNVADRGPDPDPSPHPNPHPNPSPNPSPNLTLTLTLPVADRGFLTRAREPQLPKPYP